MIRFPATLNIQRTGAMLALLLLFMPAAVRAQWPPDTLKNLQLLPKGIAVQDLVPIMAGFTRALGVRCSHCHVGEEGAPLATYDFASDDKKLKLKARVMLRMVRDINDRHLTTLIDRNDPPVRVECLTCHRGTRVPRKIQDEMRIAYEAGGLSELVTRYRALREQFYGRATYDFGSVPLAEVGDEITQRGALADAEAVHELNVTSNPGDWFAQSRHANVALLRAFVEAGADSGVARYHELARNYLPRAIQEGSINRIGYELLRRNQFAEAIALFQLNVESHPDSWTVHDSLGEAYARAGQKELAIRSYRRSLELNSDNENAREKLRELGGS